MPFNFKGLVALDTNYNPKPITFMNNREFLKHVIHIKQQNYVLDGSNGIITVIDMDLLIQHSSSGFNEYFNNGKAAHLESILTLEQFQVHYREIEAILSQTILEQKKSKIIIFIKNKDLVYSYIIEFLPIINPSTRGMAGISLIVQKYEEHGLLFQCLKQKTFSMGVRIAKKSINHANLSSKLTQFQLTICYLITYNYANQQIADIINLLDKSRHTSKSSINKQVEHIREKLLLNSKNEITDLLVGINFYNYLPSTIFKESIVVLE